MNPLSHLRPPRRRAQRSGLRSAAAAAGVAALVIGAGTATVLAAPASAATPACQVTYSATNQWNVGFGAAITITNNMAAVSSWTLGFAFTAGQAVTDGWDGTWTQSGANVNVTSESWNGAIASGGSVQIGFNGSWSGSNPAPTAFTLNGVACNGGSAPPPTTPPPTTTSPVTPPPTTAPPTTAPPTSPPPTSGAAPQLQVSGNKLVDQNGATVVLHGVDRSGGEYSCVQGTGIWDGPMDQTAVSAIKSWGVTAVRVPLNEACWNAESYVTAADAGANYQSAVTAYVKLLNANGIVAILDLHWTDGVYTGNSSGCSSAQATCQKPMPDAAGAVPFWTSVAGTFKGNDAVIFDLFNEPYPDRAMPTETAAWQCWLNGGSSCSGGISYTVAGMQSLVTAVRSTGANNVLMLGGLAYSNDLTQWLQYEPTDPDHDLAASWHSYNFNTCSNQSCWTSQIAPVIAKVPLIAGEIGENDCSGSYINPLMNWLDSQGTGYLAWTWNDWSGGCSSGPTLITDYTGTPTAYGSAYKAHLLGLG
ncbi:MAG TPA: cellulase family glycosylhydrolase [Actinocrinis sp.]|nr:cellulase family glycosylhydrolase [Actinocrinis sp.]